jgi:hypothetical protein
MNAYPPKAIGNKHDVHPMFLQTGRISSIYDNVWGFDTETFLITPARVAPPMVCLTYDDYRGDSGLLHAKYDRARILDLAWQVLCTNTLIVGVNVAYDLAVLANEFPELLPFIFRAYEEDRIVEVSCAQQLLDIANACFRGRYGPDGVWVEHGYGLDDLVRRHFGVAMNKDDSPRLVYGTLADTPCDRWTQGQQEYALNDARWAKHVWARLDVPENQAALIDIFRQSRAAWWLHLMVTWGFAVDAEHISNLKAQMIKERDQLAARLRAAGLIKWDDKKDTKAAKARLELAYAAKGIPLKKTDGDDTSLDEEACLDSGDPVMKDYARYTSVVGILNKDIAALEPAALKKVPIQSRFDGLIETGRVSCSGGAKKKKTNKSLLHTFQLHNVRREPGVRESFVGREGTLLLSADYVMFELCTWAQVCIKICGYSELAKVLNARRDVHLDLGAEILGCTYEEAFAHKSEERVKDARQMSKPANFGFPGGMGWRAFQAWAKANYGVVLSDQQAKDLHAMWKRRWPEHKPYFDYISSLVGQGDWGTVQHLFSQRLRAGVPYTVACNSFFQGLAADCAKHAGFNLAVACYVDTSSPLYGCRIVNFIHDEFILEVPIARAHECSMEVVRIMEESGKLWCPDVSPRAEPALMHRWRKAAEPVWANGRLIPWTPDIGAVRKASSKGEHAKIIQLWPKLNQDEQTALLQEGIALAA